MINIIMFSVQRKENACLAATPFYAFVLEEDQFTEQISCLSIPNIYPHLQSIAQRSARMARRKREKTYFANCHVLLV